jgi:hypothetical protein
MKQQAEAAGAQRSQPWRVDDFSDHLKLASIEAQCSNYLVVHNNVFDFEFQLGPSSSSSP